VWDWIRAGSGGRRQPRALVRVSLLLRAWGRGDTQSAFSLSSPIPPLLLPNQPPPLFLPIGRIQRNYGSPRRWLRSEWKGAAARRAGTGGRLGGEEDLVVSRDEMRRGQPPPSSSSVASPPRPQSTGAGHARAGGDVGRGGAGLRDVASL
jgi:hypothetical protein